LKIASKLAASFLLLALARADAIEPVTAKVVGDRVNLRARPDRNAEVVGQVAGSDVLAVKSIQDEWVEVVPPVSVELWVHQDFIQDGKSAVDKLNVRAGPGINYNVVGTLAKGEAVTSKGTFNDWIRIAPMPSASLWVSKELVELVLPVRKTVAPAPVAKPPPQPKPFVVAPPAPVVPAKPAPPPSDLVLIPLEGQGKSVDREGELKPAPYVMNRPSAFRLVQRSGNRIDTICYLRGNTAQLETMLGMRIKVRGREYWTQGVREPIVVIDGIETRAPSAAP
jgi:SH3-like domain-containing protein